MDYGAILVVVSGISKWYMQMKQDEFHLGNKSVYSHFFSSDNIFLCPDFLHHTNGRELELEAHSVENVEIHAEADVLVLPA